MVEIMHLREAANINKILEDFADPQEREKPYDEVGSARHVSGALGDQDIFHSLTSGYLAVIDTRGQEDTKAHDKG